MWSSAHPAEVSEVVMQPVRTLHGQLQRGLGRAARRAADKPGAGEYVYDCVRRDPRWDHQCESRSLYYARLMVDLELPIAPVAAHLFDPADLTDSDEWRVRLAIDVLGDLVRLSRREAAGPLRRYAIEGNHWFDALDALTGLRDPELTVGLDAIAAARCDDHDLDLLVTDPANPVVTQWAARRPRIAEAATKRLARWSAGPRRGGADLSGRNESDLLELARRRDDDAVAAIFELGRRRAPGLLDLAEEVLPQRPTRWGGAVCRALREFGPGALTRARSWARARRGCEDAALSILARYGTRQDIPLLMTELKATVAAQDWGGAATSIEGLGRLRAGEAVPVFKAVWVDSPYAYLRPRVLTALHRTAPHTAEAYATEGLWDCEEGVRHAAARAVPLTDETVLRLRHLHGDAAEDPQVRTAAGHRI